MRSWWCSAWAPGVHSHQSCVDSTPEQSSAAALSLFPQPLLRWPCASWSVGTSRLRHACTDRPVSMSGGALFLLMEQCAPSRACAGRTEHVRHRVRLPFTSSHREALLKVLCSRGTRSEPLCRFRRFTPTVSAPPRPRHRHTLCSHSCSPVILLNIGPSKLYSSSVL